MTSKYPGVVQLVARDIWDVEAARSSRATRTKKPLKSDDFRGFFFVYCGAGFEEYRYINPSICLVFDILTEYPQKISRVKHNLTATASEKRVVFGISTHMQKKRI